MTGYLEIIGYLEKADREVLRELAKKVEEIGYSSENNARRRLWRRHNGLEERRPMLLVEYEWTGEIIPEQELQAKSELVRSYERQFRRTIYAWEHFNDDAVVEPTVRVPLVYSMSDWGFEVKRVQSPESLGAWAYDPPLKDPADISKLRVPEIEVDEDKTHRNYLTILEAIDDIVPVKIHRHIPISIKQHCILADLRGLEQLMYDLHDRPEWVKEVMGFLTEGILKLLKYTEKRGYLELNNTGSMNYTDELPQPDFDGRARLEDLWGRSESQEFERVSPAMFENFLLNYQIQLLELFGLNDYGCCECLTDRLELVKKIPRLRRVNINSASPQTDLEVAANSLQDDYIFSLRINPSIVSTKRFDPDEIRKYMRERLAIVKDCIVEIRLHGVRTLNNQPQRLGEWSRITNEVIEELW